MNEKSREKVVPKNFLVLFFVQIQRSIETKHNMTYCAP